MRFQSSVIAPMKAEQERKMREEEDASLIIYLKKEVEAALLRTDSLEKENQDLRQEVVRLKAQICSLKAHDNERKSMLWKKLQNPFDSSKTEVFLQKQSDFVKVSERSVEHSSPRPSIQELAAIKEKHAKVPNPPPRPTSIALPSLKEANDNKLPPTSAPPPPPPPPNMCAGSKAVRRVPEVVEFYRLLTRRDAHMENRTNSAAIPVVAFTPNMIGEIENRSSYLSAIKSDVEKQKEFINFLIKEVESSAFNDISDVKAFVKWLDDELSSLVDERAVLKHFPQWPERKADALREAAFNYRDLMNLESEVSSFQDNPKDPLTLALGRMQALQDRLERSIDNMERTRESMIKRYRDFQIPWEWLLNTGLIGQMKLSSLRLAKVCLKRTTKELQLNECSGEDNLLLQGARFAYRVHQNCSSASLELDLEHYVVPAPSISANSALVYAANNAENPRFSNVDGPGNASFSCQDSVVSADRPATIKMEVVIPDPSKIYSGSGMVESKSVGTFSPLQKQDGHRGLFVDRGVGSPRLVKSSSSIAFSSGLKLDTETKNSMPAAAGAVTAAAVADQMLGPKEDRHLAIVLVGLPARGKTFTAAKLTRYLRWLGHDTKHFNVGKYRRLKHGSNQSADFFRADNPEGMEARNEVAALAMEDMISWMQEGGQVGIFDATNSNRKRRNMLMKMAEGKCKIIFLETLCNDERIIERNIRLKIQQSPDYEEQPDFEAGLQDFKSRLANYEKVYEPVEEGSYIKMIDMASGHGGQIQVNNISGYLPGRIVFFLVNTHLTPRPILLTRHGESRDNVRGRIGGDTVLSDAGEIYAKKLTNFVEKRLKSEKAASIWTSTLQRTIITASPIPGFPKIQWRALDEINAGVCDGMTYEEIKKNMPEEYEARKKDKLRYRYPRGESYLDVIQRLEPVIIELERQRAPVVVISHQAVLRALYAYFADRPLKEIPHIEVPLHTIIEIQMGVTGVQEKRYKLMD